MSLDQEAWQIILASLALLLLVIILVSLAWMINRRFVRRWRNQFANRMGDVQAALKTVEIDLDRMSEATQNYTPDDPEPYGSLAGKFHQILARSRQEHASQVDQLNHLVKNRLSQPKNYLEQLWFGFWIEPRYWRRRHRAIERLWLSTQEPRKKTDRASQLFDALRRLPLAVARRSQELYAANDELTRIVQNLYISGIQGQTLDSAADEIKQLESRLKTLPVCFFQQSDSLVIEEADKKSTIRAWQTLAEIEGPLHQNKEIVQQWQAAYREAGRHLAAMRQAVGSARLRLSQAPAEIDVSSHTVELEQAALEADELEARYRAPTVEILTDLSERILGVTEVSGWLVTQADSLTEKASRFRELMSAGRDLLAQTATMMNGAAHLQLYPLAWSQSQAELDHLRRLEAEVGPVEQPRTPAELEQHLAIASQLESRIRALRSVVVHMIAQREKLLSLLVKKELADEPGWLDQAERLHRQGGRYAPKNWPDDDAVDKIGEIAQHLAERRTALVPPQSSQPLAAEELGSRLSEVQILLAEIEAFQNRLQRTEEILHALRQMEEEARHSVDVALGAMEPLHRHLQKLEFSTESAADKHARKLSKLRKEGRKVLATLNKPKSGLIVDKERRVADWAQSVIDTLQALQAELVVEFKITAGRLQADLQALEEVAPFDRERSVREARQLAQSQALPHEVMVTGRSGQDQVELLIEQIFTILDQEENLYQARQTLNSQVTDKVTARRQRLLEVQAAARAVVERLERSLNNSWPAVSYDLKPITSLLDQADKELARLKQSGRTVGQVLTGLEVGVRRYQNIQDEAVAALQEIRNDQERARTTLDQVDRWQRKLEQYRTRQYEDAALARAVNQRLSAMAEKRAEAHRPNLSFDQVQNILNQLERLAYQDIRVEREDGQETIGADEIE